MRRVPIVVAIGLSHLLLGADCVDGVTPDCGDAAAQCGPSLDASAAKDTGAPVPDASEPADAASDVDVDADLDGAADAGEG